MSDTTTLKWLEKVLIPILVAGFLALSTCAVNSNETITRLEAAATTAQNDRAKTDKALTGLATEQRVMRVEITKISTHQEHVIQELEELKRELQNQNIQILDAIKDLR